VYDKDSQIIYLLKSAIPATSVLSKTYPRVSIVKWSVCQILQNDLQL